MGFSSLSTGNRFTIMTKPNTHQRYGYMALVFDVLTSSTISQGTSSPIHAVQGGSTINDHIFTNNVGISFTAKVSDSNRVQLGVDAEPTSAVTKRNSTGLLETLTNVNDNVIQYGFVIQDIDSSEPLTQEQVDALNNTTNTFEKKYEVGDTISEEELSTIQSQNNHQNTGLVSAIETEEQNIADFNSELTEGVGDYKMYHGGSNIGKQSSALNLLENIRRYRLLVDVLLPEGLYTNYVLSFDVLNQDASDDLTISGSLTEYRFSDEEEVDIRPYSIRSPEIVETEQASKNETKEITKEGLLDSAKSLLGI